MIEIRKARPTDRLIELGCGENPSPSCDVHVDVRPIPGVTDFACDFNSKLPIDDRDFDGVYSAYCLEHLSYRNVPQFIAEVFRILRPGGSALIVTANTEEQLRWVQRHPDGWEEG